MSYIVEDNFNFYQQLSNELMNTNTEDADEDICLLTYEKLGENYITLKCNHRFNYIPLYNELCKQKASNNFLETKHLALSQIKCPYCREITDGLLPYIKSTSVNLKRGVNYPSKYSLIINNCCWVYKSGKNKNQMCNKGAYIENGNIYCLNHHNQSYKKENLLENTITNWGDIEEKISKKYNIIQLKNVLKEHKLKVTGNKKDLIMRITNSQIPIPL